MSTVFLGTTDFAAAILERLAGTHAHRPALVLSRPDRPRGRGRALSSPPVADTARKLGLSLAQPQSVNDSSVAERVRRLQPDALVVCAFGAIIKEPLLSQHEMLNVHPSLLPRWRGAAPIERAIMAGDTQTGVSILRLTAGLDSGPVCFAEPEPIGDEDTYGSLAERLQRLGGDLLLSALDLKAEVAELPFVEQQEQGVTYAEKIGPEDRLLDPARAAVELERVVRALDPHVGARVELADGTLLGVRGARLLDHERSAAPALESGGSGQGPVARDGRLLLDCTPGTLELLVVQPPGGRAMDAASYLRGRGLPGRR